MSIAAAFRISALLTLVLAGSAAAPARADGPQVAPAAPETRPMRLWVRTTGVHERSLFQLDITNSYEPVPGVRGWAVDIRCVDGCEGAVDYRDEDTPGFPAGAFQLSDAIPQFVTLWGTGSAYRVVIYDFSGPVVRKVLDAGTRGAPQFVILADHTLSVVTQPRSEEMSAQDVQQEVRVLPGILWSWNGTEYVQSH